MRKEISFTYPFAPYASLDFINCFASAYMCLEGYDGTEPCYCGDKYEVCTSCGNCKASPAKKQEELFFLFGTVSGDTALRDSFDGPTELQATLRDSDEQIAFLMQYAGYSYEKVTAGYRDAIIQSIDDGRPALARLKRAGSGSFRVITGYDRETDALLCPEPARAQNPPTRAPSYDELMGVYVVTGKAAPAAGMREGFERVVRVMEYNRDQGLWGGYLDRFRYWDELTGADLEEIRRRFNRVHDTMWHTFSSHNFGEAFARELYHRTEDERLRERFRGIRDVYWSTHGRCWQVIALHQGRDWSKRLSNEMEAGLCDCVTQCLEVLKQNDEAVLALVKECVGLLS
jgi:hypothetical protein